MKVIAITSYSQKSCQKNIPSFNGHWKLDVLKKTDDEVMELARYFYKSNEQELKNVTTVRIPVIGIKRKFASIASYYKMKCATDKITSDVQGIKTRLAQLEQLYHLSIREAEEINTLKSKLTLYNNCFNQRYEKFYST